MFENRGWLNTSTAAFFLILLLGLIQFYFDDSSTERSLLLFAGLVAIPFFAIAIQAFGGYLNPADWLYEHRYTVEGIGFGFLFASIILAINLADNQPFGAMDLVLPFILGPVFGIMWINTTKHKKLKNWTNSIAASESGVILCNDTGSLIGANNLERKGLIILTRDSVMFKPFFDKQQKVEIDLSETNPQLEKSWTGFFKTPSGIQLSNDWSIRPAKFPQYWLQKIKTRKKISRNPDNSQ